MEEQDRPLQGVVFTHREIAALLSILQEHNEVMETVLKTESFTQEQREQGHDCLKASRSAYKKMHRAAYGAGHTDKLQ